MTLDTAYVTSVDARALRPAGLWCFSMIPPSHRLRARFPTIVRFARACARQKRILHRLARLSSTTAPLASASVATGRICSILTPPRVVTQDGFSSEVEVEVEVARDGTDVASLRRASV